MAHHLYAATVETRMVIHGYWDWQRAYRAEISFWPLLPLAVQTLVLELGRTLLACLLVLLAVGPLAIHAAVIDDAAGRAVLEPDGVGPELAAVGAGFITLLDRHAVHHRAAARHVERQDGARLLGSRSERCGGYIAGCFGQVVDVGLAQRRRWADWADGGQESGRQGEVVK